MARQGVRSTWEAIPEQVRVGIAEIAGAPVAATNNLPGGFSPGPAVRCELDDGRVVFVKAAGTELNPDSPSIHRREGEVLAMLSAGVPAPRLIGVFDDGDWVALVIEWVDGNMPVAPLNRASVDRLLGLVERLSNIAGEPALQPCLVARRGIAGHWAQLIEGPLAGLDRWTQHNLQALADLEVDVHEAVSGDRLVHMDLRSDNVIFSKNDTSDDVIVDWPGASLGAPWIDLVGLLPSLELDGGPPPEEVFVRHPVGKAADPDAVNSYLAAVAGYFTRMSLLPSPPGLPTLRQFQAAQGAIARRWLGQRRGWPPANG